MYVVESNITLQLQVNEWMMNFDVAFYRKNDTKVQTNTIQSSIRSVQVIKLYVCIWTVMAIIAVVLDPWHDCESSNGLTLTDDSKPTIIHQSKTLLLSDSTYHIEWYSIESSSYILL